MCGFLGEISNNLTDRASFLKTLNQSQHRGPDQQADWTDGKRCRFGFNRLAILDLSEKGRQPFHSPSGRYVLVFNGEIYNYKDLQKKFGIQEKDLRSTADSEIIAQLIDRLPVPKLAAELNGMYAIAIYDKYEQKTFLLRDFAGIKPLFYGITSTCIVFASQFDQVFQHPAFWTNLKIDIGGLYDYTSLGYMAAPRTIFKNIYQCQPGELIEIDTHLQIKKSIFQIWNPKSDGNLKEEEAVSSCKMLDSVLGKVVKDQLVADVPLGVFLSGGIDSPLVAAYAKQHKADITAYTIGLRNSILDESEQAKIYAAALRIQHQVIYFGEKELLQHTEQHFQALSEPFGDYSSLPTYLITHIARRENTVMLSGDGGDELFWGYPRFLNTTNHFDWFQYPKPIRKLGAGLFRRAGRPVSYAVSHADTLEAWVLGQQSHNNVEYLRDVLPDLTYSSEVLEYYTPKEKIRTKEELLQWLRWNEFYGHLQRVLTKVDRASMGNSMEVRVPFLDRRVIDFAWQLKPSLGIRHQEPKYLLKKLLQQKLEDTPINKTKLGFGVPIRQWLQRELKQDLEGHLLEIPLFGAEFCNKAVLEQRVKAFLQEDQGNEWGIWIWYALQKWASKYHFNEQ